MQLAGPNRALELGEVSVWARREWDCQTLCRHGTCTREGTCVCDANYMGSVCEANVLTDHVFLPPSTWISDEQVRNASLHAVELVLSSVASVCPGRHGHASAYSVPCVYVATAPCSDTAVMALKT